MKLKPKIVILFAPIALSFGLWVDHIADWQAHAPATQQEVRIEMVNQSEADDSEVKTLPLKKIAIL